MKIKILGTGCKSCKLLFENAELAVKELGVSATVEKEEDMANIMSYGVMRTPALVIDEKVAAVGVQSKDKIKELINEMNNPQCCCGNC